MIGAVDQRYLDIDDREAGKHTSTHDRVQALFDAGDVFLRNRSADDLGLELVALALLVRLDDDLDARELARTAGLLLVGIVDSGRPYDGLAIGDLRGADIDLDLVGALQDVDLDVEMKLAHALDDGLAGLGIGRDAEGRVLGSELVQRDAHLLLVGLGLRLDRHFDDRIREFHLLKDDRLGRIAQRVAGAACP